MRVSGFPSGEQRHRQRDRRRTQKEVYELRPFKISGVGHIHRLEQQDNQRDCNHDRLNRTAIIFPYIKTRGKLA